VTSERLRVGVIPAHEHRARPRLWAALEATHAVRFEAREPGEWRDLDALVELGPSTQGLSVGLPRLHALGEEAPGGPRRSVALSRSAVLSRSLRGAQLSDAHAVAFADPSLRTGEEMLATLDGSAAWVREHGPLQRHRVACAPAELQDGEAMRERLQTGRNLALLALVQFLRDLDPHFRQGPLRAAFVIDDPNLHWPSYGHIRYAELLRHAREHGYHVAIAMTPLDGWLAHPRAVRVFGEGARHLSICVHGNDHDGPELARADSWRANLALANQALSRSAAFERRTGLTVERVMVPPHERITESAAQALRVSGFQAICTTRPYPWLAVSSDVSWLQGPPQVSALSGWRPAEIVADGVPMLLRTDFFYPREDHVLRAFLGQPMILYGHHDLLADGLDVLAQATHELDGLGDVHWSSLGEIARACTTPQPAKQALEESARIAAPPLRLRPVLRRLLSEGRDRLQAIG
jgi:hypothetical protein